MSERATADVGLVYERDGELLLAVEPRTLIGYQDGERYEARPRQSDSILRAFDVSTLCTEWKIALKTLDAITREWLPRPQPVRRRVRGSHRTTAERHHLWRTQRLHAMRMR